MKTQLLYLQDTKTLEFQAEVQEIATMPDGRIAVVLNHTYFYPTGGGQEHDIGILGDANVVDVVKDDTKLGSTIYHIIDKDISVGTVKGKVDAGRRLRHMQHHTAQHLISQCFLQLFRIESISSNINGYAPSTLDLATPSLSRQQLNQVEDLANQIIYETLAVRTYFVSPEQINHIPVRKPPKVKEDIRIVEIDGYDFTPCGGTHCTNTGQIGIIKILKTERQGSLSRIYFITGEQAFQYFREYQETVQGVANLLSIHPKDVYTHIQHMSEQAKILQREIQSLRLEKIGAEAYDLVEKSTLLGHIHAVIQVFENRPILELRSLADILKNISGVVALLASYEEPKVSILVTCADDTGFQARDILQSVIASIGGKGGGDRQIAQGGGTISAINLGSFQADFKSILDGCLQQRK